MSRHSVLTGWVGGEGGTYRQPSEPLTRTLTHTAIFCAPRTLTHTAIFCAPRTLTLFLPPRPHLSREHGDVPSLSTLSIHDNLEHGIGQLWQQQATRTDDAGSPTETPTVDVATGFRLRSSSIDMLFGSESDDSSPRTSTVRRHAHAPLSPLLLVASRSRMGPARPACHLT